MSTLEIINKEINQELTPTTANALLATTFKGLTGPVMKQAIMEGMMRGFTFKDFLEKNVYAIPFSSGYSLITSIDYARKIGMRSGVVGTSKPEFENDEKGHPVACTITVKRKVGEYVGEYSATAYFDEYYKAGYKGKPSLWDTKPRTMLAKVAEMHALRKACPEELAKAYVEEEMQGETVMKEAKVVEVNTDDYKQKLESAKDLKELQKIWSSIPVQAKEQLKEVKEEMKKKYENA
jgi:hypothetical protein